MIDNEDDYQENIENALEDVACLRLDGIAKYILDSGESFDSIPELQEFISDTFDCELTRSEVETIWFYLRRS